MRKSIYGIFAAIIIVSFSGCGTTYISLEGSVPNKSKVNDALKECKVDDKIYKLNEEQNKISFMISAANIKGKAKKDLEDSSKNKEIKVNEEIETCMKEHGLKKK